jgi:hypothetical protein
VACGTSDNPGGGGGDGDTPGEDPGGDPGGEDPSTPPPAPEPTSFEIRLVREGAGGMQRINFAIPLAPGAIEDTEHVRVLDGERELPAARRALGRYPDGSPRSLQLQVELDPALTTSLHIEVGPLGVAGLEPVPVATLLTGTGGDTTPRVWALLPASVLSESGLLGPLLPQDQIAGTPQDAWAALCDYAKWDTARFLAASSSRDVWLYDRVTAMYRGYAITGDIGPLRSAYREAGIYRAGISIANGTATGIGVPTASDDLKYHYSQGMALHYLLTGDERFREAAEAIAARVKGMWNPVYSGDRFWSERHAGFALLAAEWAQRVSDDRAAEFAANADAYVDAFLAAQRGPLAGSDPEARCFAHTATAHGEDFGTTGCSPWMSAILADSLDAYATRVGGAREAEVRVSLARLGRAIARKGLDGEGRPFYWMAVSGGSEIDDFDEHWGESAYVIALGWRATGGTDPELRAAADKLIAGLRDHGEVGQLRSFNWQCRSAVMTPAFLR